MSSVYILVALGFAFLFNMLGIINLAHGSIYMIGAYLCYTFITTVGLNPWIALIITTVIMAAVGLFLERFFYRPFVDNFNRTVMICVALTVFLETSVNILRGNKVETIPPFVAGIFKYGSVSISYQRLITFAIGAILLGLIVWFINRSKYGQQMQAIAQDREAASLQGISVNLISALSLALGCGLATIAGSLMGSYLNLSPNMGDDMLIKVLILVMVAGMGSFGGIFITGLMLGILDAVLPVVTNGAISDAITVIIVIIILLFRPTGFFGHEAPQQQASTPDTSTQDERTTSGKKWGKPTIYAAVVTCLALLPLLFNSPYALYILILTFTYIIVSSSFRTITISGQFPMAHGAYFGLGAYFAGMASRWLMWPPWLTIPLAALAVAAVGILIGYPFSRLRELSYALGSLFFGLAVIYIIYVGGIWTGGYNGLVGIHPIFGISKIPYYYFFLGLTVVSCLVLYRFEFSRIGTNIKAVAQSHVVASSMGINESFYRVLAVAVGCFFVGLAGAAYAHYNQVLSPTSFNLSATLWIIMYVLIGGINNFSGPIIGTAVLIIIPELFRGLLLYNPYISVAILILVVYLMPQGIVGFPKAIRSWYVERKKREKVVDVA